jgi:hypothetical protein
MHPLECVAVQAASQAQPIDDEVLLTSAQTRVWLGNVSNMCLWRWTRDQRVQFPEPDLVINGRRYWYTRTIRRFRAERAAKAAA